MSSSALGVHFLVFCGDTSDGSFMVLFWTLGVNGVL